MVVMGNICLELYFEWLLEEVGVRPVHAQSLESVFSSIPGLKVFMPVFPSEGCQLLAEAINDNNPVVLLSIGGVIITQKILIWKINHLKR